MRPAEARIRARGELAALITETCNRRRDSDAHRQACINQTLREPEADWPAWAEYWRSVDPRNWPLEIAS